MSARISPLEAPYSPEIEIALNKMMPPNAPAEPLKLFRVLVKHPDLMSRMRPLGAGILGHGLINPRERELLILRTCAKTGAEYEWGVHASAFGAMVGLSKEEIKATVDDSLVWSKPDAALITLVDELVETSTLSENTWQVLQEFWEEAQIIEMLVLVGWYHTIAFVCNAAQVPYEDWAARFPKD